MMLALGMFVFEIGTLPYREMSRKSAWRFEQTPRFRAASATQFVGPEPRTRSISGALYPGEGIGAYSAYETIEKMADAGEAYSLVDGLGNVLGDYVIRSLTRSDDVFFVDGVARKADFQLEQAA